MWGVFDMLLKYGAEMHTRDGVDGLNLVEWIVERFGMSHNQELTKYIFRLGFDFREVRRLYFREVVAEVREVCAKAES